MNQEITILREQVESQLKTVIDPELGVDIVSLGLVYGVEVVPIQTKDGVVNHVHILMTLTTPGCPLVGVFEQMVKSALVPLAWLDTTKAVTVELTFDPPWVPDMMTEEARAELGL